MADPDDQFLTQLDSAICPVTPVPASPLDVALADVAAGQAKLAALTGRYLPPVGSPSGGPGATAITGGGGQPVESSDRSRQGANTAYGFMGEQCGAFIWGERGYELVFGPSGAGGKSTSASGLDGLPWQAATKSLALWDNKQSVNPGALYSATAVNENLLRSVEGAIGQVSATSHPDRTAILDKLQQFRLALTDPANHAAPDGVRIVISNAGGYAGGIAPSLQDDFHARWGHVLDGTGNPIALEWDNVQPPATLQAAQSAAAASSAQGQKPVPLSQPATPAEPVIAGYRAVSPVSSYTLVFGPAASGTAVAEALPMLLHTLLALLAYIIPKLGAEDATQRVLKPALTEALTHLQGDRSQGALLMVGLRSRLVDSDQDPWLDVVFCHVYFGAGAQQAYEARLRDTFIELPAEKLVVRHDIYFWYQAGKLEPFFPG